jgi:hypothetical protein
MKDRPETLGSRINSAVAIFSYEPRLLRVIGIARDKLDFSRIP